MKTLFGTSLRVLYRLAAGCIIAMAIMLALLHLAFRSLSLFQTEVVGFLGNKLGVQIDAEIETTQRLGQRPTILVSNAVIGDEASAIRVATLRAEPDFLGSLLSLSPVWHNLQLTDVQIPMQEQPNGGWQIAGIDLVSEAGSSTATIEKMLLSSDNIVVENADVLMRSYSGTELSLALERAQFENEPDFHRLVANANLDGDANQFALVVELAGEGNRFYELDGSAYLKLDGTELAEPVLSVLDRFTDTPLKLDKTPRLSGNFWANIRAGSSIDFQGQLEIINMPGQLVAEDLRDISLLSDVAGRLSYFDHVLAVGFVAPNISVSGQRWPIGDFGLTRHRLDGNSNYSVQFDQLDLGSLKERVSELSFVPERVLKVVNELNPIGLLQNVEFSLQTEDPLNTLTLYADIVNVGIDKYDNVPAVKNVSGQVHANAFGGSVQVDSENLTLKYHQVYDWWLDHGATTGNVSWQFDLEKNEFFIFSTDVVARSPFGELKGAFFVDSGITERQRGVDLYVNVGVCDLDATDWDKLTPATVPQGLRDWLIEANPTGRVIQAAALYRGAAKEGLTDFRSFQVRLQTEELEANYLPSWPRLTDVDADILVSNNHVWGWGDTAYVPGIELRSVQAHVDPENMLSLSADIDGETDKLLDLVRQTNLRRQVGSSLDQLKFDGRSQVDAKVSLPLVGQLTQQDVDIDLHIDLQDNSLQVTQLDLSFDEIHGLLRFGNDGLAADELNALFWGEPLTVSIFEDRDLQMISIESEGTVSAVDLQRWLDVDVADMISGKTGITSLLEISTDRNSELQNKYFVETDLVGVETNLPGELSKTADEKTPLEFSIENTAEQRMRLDWSKGLALELRRPNNRSLPDSLYESGVFAINHVLPEHQTGKIIGNIFYDFVDVNDWIARLPSGVAASSTKGKVLGLIPEINVQSINVIYNERNFGHLDATITGSEDDLDIRFVNDFAIGDYFQPYDPTRVPSVNLLEFEVDKFRELFASIGSNETASEVEPKSIPALDFEIESLVLSGKRRGSWQGSIRSTESGARIENLRCEFKSLRCNQDAADSFISWTKAGDEDYSSLNLVVDFEDVTDMFDLFDAKSPLTSSEGEFYISVNWDAEPYEFASAPLSGVLGVDLEDGSFLTQPGSVTAGLARVIGLVNVNTWWRRLRLDFSDVAAQGTAYDELSGDFTINNNVVSTLTPLYAKLPSGRMLLDGSVGLDQREIDAQLVVTLPARQNLTWIAALAAGLPAAVGVWIVGQIFDDELDNLASVSYRVTGSLGDPQVDTDRLFSATVDQDN